MSDPDRNTTIPLPGAATVLLTIAAAVAGWMIWQAGQTTREEDAQARRKNAILDPEAPFRERVRSVELWVQDGPDAVPELLQHVDDSSPRVRAAVVLALGRIGAPSRESVSALLRSLDDPEPEVRGTALSALQGLFERRVLDRQPYMPRVLRMLEDPDEAIRRDAFATAMHAKPDSATQAELMRLLASSRSDTRRLAAQLVRFVARDPDSLALVRNLLQDQDSAVRNEAFATLAAFGAVTRDEAIASLTSNDQTIRTMACEILEVFGPHAVPAAGRLRELLSSTRDVPPVLRALAGTRDAPLAVPLLQERLHGPDSRMARVAGETLARCFPEQARAEVPRLLDLLEQSDPVRKRAVLRALGGLGVQAAAAVPVLIDLINDPDPPVAWYAVEALSRIGPPAADAVPILVTKLHSELPASIILEALGNIGRRSADAERVVIELIEHELTVWERDRHRPDAALWRVGEAVYALGRLAQGGAAAHATMRRVLQLSEELGSVTGLARGNLLASLAELRFEPRATIGLLLAEITNPQGARVAAARGLGFFPEGADQSVPVLTELLDDEDPDVQLASASALGRLGGRALAAVPALRRMAGAPHLNPQSWQYVLREDARLVTIWNTSVPDPASAHVAELAALPLSAAAKKALDQIEAAAPVAAPRPE